MSNDEIDYARAQRIFTKRKGAMTRAKRRGPLAVVNECIAAEREFRETGSYPDNWSMWAVAYDDAILELSAVRDADRVMRGTDRRLLSDEELNRLKYNNPFHAE